MSGKTLEGLNPQVGDVFSYAKSSTWEILPDKQMKNTNSGFVTTYPYWDSATYWTVVSRESPPVTKYGPWSVGLEVTAPADADIKPLGDGWVAYRLPIKPVVVTKTCYVTPNDYVTKGFNVYSEMTNRSVARLTFNIVDGVPDCDSVKMTKL